MDTSRVGWRRIVVVGIAACALMAAATGPVAARTTDDKRLDAVEKEVRQLRRELEALRAERAGGSRYDELARRIDVLAGEIESLRAGKAVVEAAASEHGMGPAASKIYRSEPGVSIGGYGEAIYQGFDATRDDGAPSGRTDTFDLTRAVFYIGYKFDDRFLFNSEIEFEHATTEEDGEASVEFAYVDALLRPHLGLRAGLLLMPVGFVNELHEPTTFLSALRPEVERSIIPTTWSENGFGLFGEAGGFKYRGYVVTALDATGFSAAGIRGGRQKGSEAKAEDLAAVARLDYEGLPGLQLGLSAYVGDAGQGLEDARGARIAARTALYEAHAEWRWRGFRFRGLAARADIGDAARLNGVLGLTGNASIGSRLTGFYLEGGYDLLAGGGAGASLTPFVRWERLDTQDRVPAGFAADPANDRRILTLGLAYQPISQLILKADYQNVNNDAGTGVDRINVALGYIF